MQTRDDIPPEDESDFPPAGWESMSGEEKDMAVRAERDRLLRRRDQLAARGDDTAYLVAELDRELARLNEAIATVEPFRRELEKTQEAFLQSSADVADSFATNYTNLNPLIQWMARTFPDDPRAANAKRAFDELARQLPRELVQPEKTMAELEEELRRMGFFNPPPPA